MSVNRRCGFGAEEKRKEAKGFPLGIYKENMTVFWKCYVTFPTDYET